MFTCSYDRGKFAIRSKAGERNATGVVYLETQAAGLPTPHKTLERKTEGCLRVGPPVHIPGYRRRSGPYFAALWKQHVSAGHRIRVKPWSGVEGTAVGIRDMYA